jgi:glycosyltransferase involved in cell wall biosynthesis
MTSSKITNSQVATPIVTIGLPTFNRLSYLERSLQSALAQTYPRLEIIVSDNHSDDGTTEYLNGIKDDRLTILRQERNLGMMGNWNAILSAATGEFFLLLSDDDYLHPEAIAEMVRCFNRAGGEDSLGLVYGRTVIVDQNDRVMRITPAVPEKTTSPIDLMLAFFRHEQPMYPCSILLRTADIRDGNGYPAERFPLAADAYAWTRVASTGRSAAFVGQAFFYYRQHSANNCKIVDINQWVSNVENLLASIDSTLRSRGEDSAANKIRAAGHDYLSSMVSGLIVQESRSGKSLFTSFSSFMRWRQYFVRGRGPRNLVRAIARLLVPADFERRLTARKEDVARSTL